ncbi:MULTISPECIES: hypothetical protein [unclassified Sulfitobacter]|uniref:hypothetical protein n=1 Tax=unclassified Sulfitobacter TaxID=196795 RepID=UPI003746DAB7
MDGDISNFVFFVARAGLRDSDFFIGNAPDFGLRFHRSLGFSARRNRLANYMATQIFVWSQNGKTNFELRHKPLMLIVLFSEVRWFLFLVKYFKHPRFPRTIIHFAVRWYLRYPLSYQDVVDLLAERGITIDRSTVYRWVQKF